jgi:hypothetical protein
VRRLDLRLRAADPHLIVRTPFAISSATEQLARRGEIAKDNAIECQDGDEVPRWRPISAVWRKSCEGCLFSHWLIVARFVGSRRTEGLLIVTPPPLLVMDYAGPALGAAPFVIVMSLVPEPVRRPFNTIVVAGTCGVYLSGGFGLWELLYPAVATPVVYRGYGHTDSSTLPG